MTWDLICVRHWGHSKTHTIYPQGFFSLEKKIQTFINILVLFCGTFPVIFNLFSHLFQFLDSNVSRETHFNMMGSLLNDEHKVI